MLYAYARLLLDSMYLLYARPYLPRGNPCSAGTLSTSILTACCRNESGPFPFSGASPPKRRLKCCDLQNFIYQPLSFAVSFSALLHLGLPLFHFSSFFFNVFLPFLSCRLLFALTASVFAFGEKKGGKYFSFWRAIVIRANWLLRLITLEMFGLRSFSWSFGCLDSRFRIVWFEVFGEFALGLFVIRWFFHIFFKFLRYLETLLCIFWSLLNWDNFWWELCSDWNDSLMH